jgi:hypothetical protein
MSFYLDPKAVEETTLRQIWPVRDFCEQYNLDVENEHRLRTLFGEYATAIELMMNVSRRPRFR